MQLSGVAMIVFITGINGQVGYEAANIFALRGCSVYGSGRSEHYRGLPLNNNVRYLQLDITDEKAVRAAFENVCPDVVVHCAAWTAVDAAEKPENLKAVRAVNVTGTENIAKACRTHAAKMIYLSTDYVFSGTGTEPWRPDDHNYAPLNVYGQSKLDGERAVAARLDDFFIVRTAWVFGANGNNFVKTMLRAGKTHEQVRVVYDQVGSPTYAKDLARLLADMSETELYGYYHATNEGEYISWYEFCCEIYRQAGLMTRVVPVSSEEYGLSAAARPFNSRLDRSKLKEYGCVPLPPWQDALKHYLREIGE